MFMFAAFCRQFLFRPEPFLFMYVEQNYVAASRGFSESHRYRVNQKDLIFPGQYGRIIAAFFLNETVIQKGNSHFGDDIVAKKKDLSKECKLSTFNLITNFLLISEKKYPNIVLYGTFKCNN